MLRSLNSFRRSRLVTFSLAVGAAVALGACSNDDDSPTAPVAAVVLDRPAAATVVSDSMAILGVVSRLDAAWGAMDAAAWSREFSPDAQFVNILGQTMDGNTAIRDRHGFLFSGPFKGSRLASTVSRLKFVGPLAAVVECNQNLTGYVALPPGARETQPGVLKTRMVHVLAKLNGTWLIISTQNTQLQPA